MALHYRHRPLGAAWPGARTARPSKSPFRGANWSATIVLLEHELRQLKATDVVFALNVADREVNLDGRLRADARVKDPAVIVECRVGADRLSFPCDTYNHWHENLRAIALALEALRKVDRYGVRKGRQYEGFKALPGAGASAVVMSPAVGAEVLARYTDGPGKALEIFEDVEACRLALRRAMQSTHPDLHGGDTSDFQQVQDARRVLGAHHGVTL